MEMLYPRIRFQKPILADISMIECNGKTINSSTSKVCVYDMSSTGISFSTTLDFPTMNEVPILLKVVLFSNCTFTGKIATKEMKDGKLYYRLSVKTCNLNFYKLVEEMNHTHRIKLPYVYKSDEVG